MRIQRNTICQLLWAENCWPSVLSNYGLGSRRQPEEHFKEISEKQMKDHGYQSCLPLGIRIEYAGQFGSWLSRSSLRSMHEVRARKLRSFFINFKKRQRLVKTTKTNVEYVRCCDRCGLRSSVLIYDDVSFRSLCRQCRRKLEKRRECLAFPARPVS